MDNLHTKHCAIQSQLNAPKDAFNPFGKYKYRSAESILAAAKPLLQEHSLTLTLNDSVIAVGERIYIKATATLSDGTNTITAEAYAREPESKKGADESQITGAASSYARKYALCGLFAIDDNKDADATNTHGKQPEKPFELDKAIQALKTADNLETLQKYFQNAWQRANKAQRNQLKAIYDQHKADFQAALQE